MAQKLRIYSAMPLPVSVSYIAPPPSAALRQVATRCRVGGQIGGGVWMNRTFHYNRSGAALSSMQVAWGNWIPSATLGEVGTGGTITITASVEYPAGTFTQLKFSASATGTIPDAATLLSDEAVLSVAIPDGAKFWIRFFWTGAVGIPYALGRQYVAGGDASAFGGTDQTMSGTVTDTGNTAGQFPVAIVARTANRALALIGDSRVASAGDTTGDASGDFGCFERPLSPTYATINLGLSGDVAAGFLAGSTRRAALAAYCTDAVSDYGINDLVGGASAATLEGRLTSVRAALADLRFFQGTIVPDTTSTDNWATTANQTTVASNANRVLVNNWLRANTPGFTGIIELADTVESARDSGKWKVDGTAFKYTPDGIHESTFANKQYVIVLP